MSSFKCASMYRAVKVVDVAERVKGNLMLAPHMGAFVACRSAAPPDVTAYDEWLKAVQSSDPRGSARVGAKFSVSGAKLRRAVVMRRAGSTFRDIATALGCSTPAAKSWLDRLPERLSA